MFKKINIKAIRDSFALLLIAAIVGTIVSFVAQLFIISAKNIYDFIFNNNEIPSPNALMFIFLNIMSSNKITTYFYKNVI